MPILSRGDQFRTIKNFDVRGQLPVGVYIAQYEMGEYVLSKRSEYAMPEKVYGNNFEFSERVMKTFGEIGKGMGVLLSGPKGSGKTLTAKMICNISGLPVIAVMNPYHGAEFSGFLESIGTKCIVFIDEIEKIYSDGDDRNGLLQILDGSASTRHLFLLTSNADDIGEFFEGRPGRIRYHKKYELPDNEMLSRIIDDSDLSDELKNGIKAHLPFLGEISPDAIMSIIEECRIHNEVPSNFISFFNVSNCWEMKYDVYVQTKIWKPTNPDYIFDVSSDLYALNQKNKTIGRIEEGKRSKIHMVDMEMTIRSCYPFRGNPEEMDETDLLVSEEVHEQIQDMERRAYANRSIRIDEIEKIWFDCGVLTINKKDGDVFRFVRTKKSEFTFTK